MGTKLPQSVLVIIHSKDMEVLLLERKDVPGFWQSVTGSKSSLDEDWSKTAQREVKEETGLNAIELVDWGLCFRYEIYPHWKNRYPLGTMHNIERVFSLCVDRYVSLSLSATEHTRWDWLPLDAAANRCFSQSNRYCIELLPERCSSRIGMRHLREKCISMT